MTKEDKDLLLKDLCARLPYGVMVQLVYDENTTETREMGLGSLHDIIVDNADGKPYLRPMSSMTVEEQVALKAEHTNDARLFAEALTRISNGDNSMHGKVIPHFAVDWCNKNHFDYHNLIEKGLALEAPEGMYKTE